MTHAPRSTTRPLAVTAAGLALVAAVAACGSGSSGSAEQHKSASAVLKDATAALSGAKAVHVQGTMGSGSDAETLDLQLQTSSASGTLTTGGIAIKLVDTGGKIYLNAPAAFWTKSAGASASGLGGKWIIVTAAEAGDIGDLTLSGISSSLNSNDSPLKPATTLGTVSGQKAIILTQQDGSQLFVADSTTPTPLKLIDRGSSTSTVTFADYGKTQTISAPAGAETAQQALGSGSSGGSA